MRGIYIHIPFCAAKCRYCDFLSFPSHKRDLHRAYARALADEIRSRVKGPWANADTVFIGGGTPTVLENGEWLTILEALNDRLRMDRVLEFTVEANPGTVSPETFQILKEGGVNRLSFGVQSFQLKYLQMLGRIHTGQQARHAVYEARMAGFENVNLDLMYGLPGQSLADWQKDLDAALAMDVPHLSLYQLMLEPHTALTRQVAEGSLPEPDEDMAADAFAWQRTYLADRGLYQYEISNYARPGYKSHHNQIYWRLEDYLGLGLGATGWTRPGRVTNTSDLYGYLQTDWSRANALEERETLSRQDQMSESVFMALRMNEGLDCAAFASLYGASVEQVFPGAIHDNIGKGLLEKVEDHLRLTDRGRLLGNLVFESFL